MQTLSRTLRWLQVDISILRRTRAALCEYRAVAPTSRCLDRRRLCKKKLRGWSRCRFGTTVYWNVAQRTGRRFANSHNACYNNICGKEFLAFKALATS